MTILHDQRVHIKSVGASLKLIFVNRYFHPDISATSQMLSGLAFHLAAQGGEVHVVTRRQRYDDPSAQLPASVLVDGVRIHRVWTSRFGRPSLPGRAMDYVSFYLAASIKLATLAKRGDIVIAKTDPPLLSVPAALVSRLRGARLVNWLQDLFTEVAERMGMRVGWAAGAIRAVRNASLRSAAVNVVLGVFEHAGCACACGARLFNLDGVNVFRRVGKDGDFVVQHLQITAVYKQYLFGFIGF